MRLTLGAVAYDRKVVDIWEGFAAWLATQGLQMDYILFSNYERQVEAHLQGVVDVAWNSPLAWLETVRAHGCARAVLMRDTDMDLTSVIITRADGPQGLAGLRGQVVAVGASDSPQATLIPLEHIAARLGDAAVKPLYHEIAVGKHGDHVGGEREAVRALLDGKAEAACLIDGNLLAFQRDGTIPAGAVRVLAQTTAYDHCNMTAIEGLNDLAVARFCELLLGMSYADPSLRPLMDLEGLTLWMAGRTSGYGLLSAACDRFGNIDEFVARQKA